MCLSCGLSNVLGAIFHLFTHAGFKALLFLLAATIFHSVINEQKTYKFGGLNKVAVLSFTLLFLGLVSLVGIPFYSGF